MKLHRARVPALAALAGVLCAAPVLADTRSVGQTLVYQMSQVQNMTTTGVNIPAPMRAQWEAAQALARLPKKATFTLNVDRVDPDGSAHLTATMGGDFSNNDPRVLARVPYMNSSQATLATDGRIVWIHDDSLQPQFDQHGLKFTVEGVQNTNAGISAAFFGDFNAFALGCAKHAHFNVGDTWRVNLQQSYTTRVLKFSVSTIEIAGGNQVAVVNMESNSVGPSSSVKLDATGRYDRVRALVTAFHEDELSSATSPSGNSSGTLTRDITLQQ